MFAERTPITTSLISVSPWLFVSSPFPLPHQMNFVRQTRVYGLGFRNENRQAFCGVYVSLRLPYTHVSCEDVVAS